jgi:hypothetical protein
MTTKRTTTNAAREAGQTERSAHTPGPWMTSPLMQSWVFANEGFVAKAEGRFTESEKIANARLIAASPELLEALEEIIKRLARDDYADVENLARCHLVARAAIAKAKGAQ